MDRVRVFVCFDREHDSDLRDRLIDESRGADSRFEVVARSAQCSKEHMRSAIDGAGGMIVICGPHTDSSLQMSEEILLAQELGKPYFLLWGRREHMCKRPMGSKSDDAMYGWTQPILQGQVVLALHPPREVAASYKKIAPKLPAVG
jgi:hypothetical protein